MKMKLNFLRIFESRSKYFITKEFAKYIGYTSGYLQKLNRGLGVVSGAYFQHIFLRNFSIYNTL